MHLCGAVDLYYRCIICTLLINTPTTNTSLNKWHSCMLSQIRCTSNAFDSSVTFFVSTTGGRGD